MAYSKAYQTVVAGRTREDEAIGFFKKNSNAVPISSGYQAVNPEGKQPANKSDALDDNNVGKKDSSLSPRAGTVAPNIPNKYDNVQGSN